MRFRFWWSLYPAWPKVISRQDFKDEPHHEICLGLWRFRLTIGYN